MPLRNLYNHCISNSYWPKEWRKSEWVPVHKKDDRSNIENYRPVNVQIIINKIFEKLLANQIAAAFNDLMSEYLTAYRKSHSCETALLMLTGKW